MVTFHAKEVREMTEVRPASLCSRRSYIYRPY